MLLSATRKARPCLSVLPEHRRTITRCQKPQQHIRQQHPDSVLHPLDPLVTLRVLGDVHLAEDAKGNQIAQEHKRIDVEEEPRLDEWEDEHERHERAESAADDAPHPFAVDVDARFARAVEVDGVEADHGETEHELEQAQDDADECADREGGPEGGAGGGFFAAQAALREEVEGHDEDLGGHVLESVRSRY